jgi:uncharacterized membrane protein YfhO
VYCGLITLLLLPIYFTLKNVSKKEKITTAVLLIFFYISFAFNALNFVWHAFHMPNDLPYRFSYIYIFFLLFIAMKTFINIEESDKKKITICSIATIVISVICAIISAPNKTSLTIIATIILGIIYVIYLLMYTKKPMKKWLSTALIVLTVFEIFIPYQTSMTTYPSNMLYAHANTVESFKEAIKEKDDGFYRMELTEFALLNPSSIYDYYGITSFSSMNYETVSYLQKQLGISSNGQNSNQYLLQTPIYNMMTSLNYILDTGSFIEVNKNNFTEIFEENGIKGYESNYKTNIGFATKDPTNWDFNNQSPFVVQESFANIVTGNDDVYFKLHNDNHIKGYGIETTTVNDTKYNYTFASEGEKSITFTTIIDTNGSYYSYMNNKKFAVQYTINDKMIMHYGPVSYPYIAYLGELNKGDVIEAKLIPLNGASTTGVIDYYLCSINEDNINMLYNSIVNNGMLIAEEWSDTYVKALINNKTEYIYTSIPYDKNWTVYVDGEAVPAEQIIKYGNAFIGIHTTIGEHIIEFKYKTSLPSIIPIMPKVITTPDN